MKARRRISIWVICCVALNAALPAQTRVYGRVSGARDGRPVAFANIWILDGDAGTSSGEDGAFSLSSPAKGRDIRLKITAIGYRDTVLSPEKCPVEIRLEEQIYALPEVLITPRRAGELTLNDLRKADIRGVITNDSSPKMLGLYFPYLPEYDDFRYLKKVLVYSTGEGSFLYNLRMYAFDTLLQQPGREIIHENLLVKSKKTQGLRHKATEIDLQPYHCSFPEGGLFVAVEWLIIPRNRYNFKYFIKGDQARRSETKTLYGPAMSATIDNRNYLWEYKGGRWIKWAGLGEWKSPGRDGNQFNPAISVVLSN